MRQVRIATENQYVCGDLVMPDQPKGVILFAHGSGSGRLSPRNRMVASLINRAGFGTMLIDLLTEEEEQLDRISGHLRFDIGFLADRLAAATRWLEDDPETSAFRLGYFGASTGAAAALAAAVGFESRVRAIVSRGGRPDLAGDALTSVTAPTLLIVGSMDGVVVELNRTAFAKIRAEKELSIVDGAGHLFEEPGQLEQVAELASKWFERHL